MAKNKLAPFDELQAIQAIDNVVDKGGDVKEALTELFSGMETSSEAKLKEKSIDLKQDPAFLPSFEEGDEFNDRLSELRGAKAEAPKVEEVPEEAEKETAKEEEVRPEAKE